MEQFIGKVLDNRYEIIELIGSGGMANVYKAKDNRLNRMDAIKILKSDLAGDAEFRRRFHDESQAIAQLSHPNIVSVYDVSSSNNLDYIVMELIDGITLKQYMERRGKLDWREALHFITQIMRGLSHAHSRGIIHRDIKPQNIMVLRDGSVKVADFGIACLESAGQTLTQEALGSVHYISPEQARGDRLDARSDIYSAGVVLYEMLTNRLPFEGDSAVSVAIQHLSSVPLTPREINPDVPETLELICMKAMCPNADKRYSSADQMVYDLEQFKKDPNVNMDYIRADLQDTEPESAEPTQPMTAATVLSSKEKKTKVEEDNAYNEKGALSFLNNKKLMYCVIGGFALALILIFVIFKFIFGGFSSNKDSITEYEVPNVVGYTVEEAEKLDRIKDIFTINVLGTKTSDDYEVGQIISQDPEAGEICKTGADDNTDDSMVINVYICAEEETFTMPNVVGEDFQQAKVILKNMKLELVIEEEEDYSTEYDEGIVCKSDPAEGTELNKGDTVTLTISKGLANMIVPQCVNMTYEEAVALAKENGFTTIIKETAESSEPVGTVIAQDLQANTEVENGTALTLTVSNGQSVVKSSVTFTAPVLDSGSTYRNFKVDVLSDSTGDVIYSGPVSSGQTFTVQVSGTKGDKITAQYTWEKLVPASEPGGEDTWEVENTSAFQTLQ